MAQQDQNGLGAMMAAQGELSSLNAARAQNSQAEQAFLQQQQAANAVMMQAAQIGTSGSLGQQVGAMNPQTQALLAQYGINGAAPQPGKTTSTNKTTQSGGNIKIENNTTTNNDIKIVNPPSQGGGDGGNQAKFQTWLSNSFAKQNQEYEVQRRAFAKRDRDLEKQSNKMMRELEKSTSTLGEKLNPKTWAAANGDQTKKVLGILLLTLAPTLIKPITDKLNDIFGWFGGEKKTSSFEATIKNILGFDKEDYSSNRTIWSKLGEIVGKSFDRLKDFLKIQQEDREKAVQVAIKNKPKNDKGNEREGWGLLLNLDETIGWLADIVGAAFGGSNHTVSRVERKIKADSIIEAREMNYMRGDDFALSGNLKVDRFSTANAIGSISKTFSEGKQSETSGGIFHLMTNLKTQAQQKGEIPLGGLETANNFLKNWNSSVSHLQELEKNDGKTYIRVSSEVETIVMGSSWGGADRIILPKGSPELQKIQEEAKKEDSGVHIIQQKEKENYYLTKDGFEKLENYLGFKFEGKASSDAFRYFITGGNLDRASQNDLYSELNVAEELVEEKSREIDNFNEEHKNDAVAKFSTGITNYFSNIFTRNSNTSGEGSSENGQVSSKFGIRKDPISGEEKQHNGIDIALNKNTPIFSPVDGTVTKTKRGITGYGNYIEITHDDGTITKYAHLNKILVKEGDSVKKDQQIALSGNSGKSTGPHLHYEVLRNGNPVDPEKETDYNYSKVFAVPETATPEQEELSEEEKKDSPEIEKTPEEARQEIVTNLASGEYLNENDQMKLKVGQYLFPIDQKTYEAAKASGKDIFSAVDVTEAEFLDGSHAGLTKEKAIEFGLDRQINRLTSNHSYEGKGTNTDVLPGKNGSGYIFLGNFLLTGYKLKSGEKTGFIKKDQGKYCFCYKELFDLLPTPIFDNNFICFNDGIPRSFPAIKASLGRGYAFKYIPLYVQLSADGKAFNELKTTRSYPTGLLGYDTGEIIFSVSKPWTKEEYDNLMDQKKCGLIAPGFFRLGVTEIPGFIKKAIDELLNLIAKTDRSNTGKIIYTESGKEVSDEDWLLLENLGIYKGNPNTDEAKKEFDGSTDYWKYSSTKLGKGSIQTLSGGVKSFPTETEAITSPYSIPEPTQVELSGYVSDGTKTSIEKISWISGVAKAIAANTDFGHGFIYGSENSSSNWEEYSKRNAQVPIQFIIDNYKEGGDIRQEYINHIYNQKPDADSLTYQ